MPEITPFNKYEAEGAYHWRECDRRYSNWRRYNPALEARYQLTVDTIRRYAKSNNSLLDIGCGDGFLLCRLAPLMQRVVGVDSEKTAIGLAREKLGNIPNCELIHVSSYELPVAGRSFDFVVSADVIEHLTDPVWHLREICRVLRVTGSLVMTTPRWRRDRKWDERHEKEYRPAELRDLLGQYFEHVELRFFWPIKLSRFYATKVGWRVLKLLAIALGNPFIRSGTDPEKFGQILAVCRSPRIKARTTEGSTTT